MAIFNKTKVTHLNNCISSTEKRIKLSTSEELTTQLESELSHYQKRLGEFTK